MFAHPTWLLQWARSFGQRLFLQFGLHCATHQVRVILISGIVITSLFYPALDVYTSKNSLSIYEALTSSTYAEGIPSYHDLLNIWSGHEQSLHVYEDAVTRAKCRNGHALRVERILIQSSFDEDDGALNRRTLLSTLNLENRLEKLISSGDLPCLREPAGKCLVVSPLAYWQYDTESVVSNGNILDILSYTKNISITGVPVTPSMVLAGRGSYDHHVSGNKFDYADYLALTYFFPQSNCWGSSTEHASWIQAVQSVADKNAEVIIQVPEATLIALEYDPHQSDASKGWSAVSASVYLAYVAFFAYIGWSARYMNAVHSRLGVTFTALVEIAVSTITSLSVCALVGFKITLVPWELLPIVIVFVGAENMFNLVDAIGKTSVTLSVKQRIAEGLSRAGTSNTLKVVSYNTILGIIAVYGTGAVRQFCVFAIVVLVAHWFLAHTFFIAVLSIDIARLELDELLRHDATLAPSLKKDTPNSKPPRSGWQKLVMTLQRSLKGRAATNISLLMLLGIAGSLYYTTYTTSSTLPQSSLQRTRSTVPRTKARTDAIPTAEHIWKTLNPTQSPQLHLLLETPIVLTFTPDADGSGQPPSAQPTAYRSRSMRTVKFFLWLLTIMVVPIAVTISALYGLLLYLLKNTELLEAQRHRQDAPPLFSSEKEEDKSLEGQIIFSTLPRAFASDVELIGASKDGKIVVSVGLHNEIMVWNADRKRHILVDGAGVLLKMASTSSASTASAIVCLSVDESGHYFAVGTGGGLIAVWSIERSSGKIKAMPLLSLTSASAAVTEIHFVPPLKSKIASAPGRTPPISEAELPKFLAQTSLTLLATYENAIAARWSITRNFPTVSLFKPTQQAAPVSRALLLHVIPHNRVLIAFCLDDGTIDVVETGDFDTTILNSCCIQPGNPFELVTKVHACLARFNGSMRLVIGAATAAGSVSFWDGLTGECIFIFEETRGMINQLRVSPGQSETCHSCGHLPVDSLSLAFSVDHVVRFSKLYFEDQARRCSCSNNPSHFHQQQMRHVSPRDGRRSRSNSGTSSQVGSPLIPRARLATAFEVSTTSAFPVSGHGVHSRRASEKDSGRRSSEFLTIPPFPANGNAGEDHDASGGFQDRSGSTTPTNASHSVWRNAAVITLADITCERGGWDVTSNKFVGIRRRPRTQAKTRSSTAIAAMLGAAPADVAASQGLTSATLERWELWTFDLSQGALQCSLVSNLTKGGSRSSSSSPRSSLSSSTSSTEGIARLPFTRVSPLMTVSSDLLAGFGNTIGVFHFSR